MIKIRLLERSDNFDDLVILSREFFLEYETYHKDFFKLGDLKAEQVTMYFSSFSGQTSRKAFIAVDGQRMVGYITVSVYEREDYWQITKIGEISGLMVQKEYRRKGIAEKLLAKAKQFFLDQELDYFTVYTAVSNQGALDFYHKSGLAPLYTTLIGEV